MARGCGSYGRGFRVGFRFVGVGRVGGCVGFFGLCRVGLRLIFVWCWRMGGFGFSGCFFLLEFSRDVKK